MNFKKGFEFTHLAAGWMNINALLKQLACHCAVCRTTIYWLEPVLDRTYHSTWWLLTVAFTSKCISESIIDSSSYWRPNSWFRTPFAAAAFIPRGESITSIQYDLEFVFSRRRTMLFRSSSYPLFSLQLIESIGKEDTRSQRKKEWERERKVARSALRSRFLGQGNTQHSAGKRLDRWRNSLLTLRKNICWGWERKRQERDEGAERAENGGG